MDTKSPGLRKRENLPPAELAVAVRLAVTRNIGLTRDETVTAVARMLGFASTTSKPRDAIQYAIDLQMVSRSLELRDGRLFLATVWQSLLEDSVRLRSEQDSLSEAL